MKTIESFDQHVGVQTVKLGDIVKNDDIKSTVGPFYLFPRYKVVYPAKVIQALRDLYVEYNRAYIPLIEKNREWETDYRFCTQPNGLPVNFAVQIDMIGLPDSFLKATDDMHQDDVREVIRGRIFEIENSIAMYQLLEKIFLNGSRDTFFNVQFRIFLDRLRKRFRKPIALLAPTNQKYRSMMEIEFGEQVSDKVSDEKVKLLTGFDRLFGPDEFRRHVKKHKDCKYLLYVRSSDPVAKLRKPGLRVEQPLLGDAEMRKIIKANTLTLNIDGPKMDFARRINDTKEYQAGMNMGFQISSDSELFTPELTEHLFLGKSYSSFHGTKKLSSAFASFLKKQGLNLNEVERGELSIRCKPMKCAYGCYGHVVGTLDDGKFRSELRRNLRIREGGYVVQLEMKNPKIINGSGIEYAYIDRNFMDFTRKQAHFIGGFRSLIPVDSHEIKKGRNHGTNVTVLGEIMS